MSGRVAQVDLAYERVAAAFDRAWKRLVRFPAGQVCKHYAAIVLFEEFGEFGLAPPSDVVAAVFDAADVVAPAWDRPPAARKGEGG